MNNLRLRTVTITPPNITLSYNEDGILVLNPQMDKTWRGINDEEVGKLQYQVSSSRTRLVCASLARYVVIGKLQANQI